MSPIAVSLIVFVCVFGGAMCGILLRDALPQDHRSADSKGVVTMSMGLVATMAALVLGLLVSSAKSFYDAQSTELTQISTKGHPSGPSTCQLWAGNEGHPRSAARCLC